MTEKAYKAKGALQEFRQLDKRVREKAERIQRLYESATRVTPSLEAERVSGTGEPSRTEAAMITKVDLERQLDNAIDELNRRRWDIQNAIDAMADEREKRILELRYIDGRPWASIMMRMEISETWSRVIHESALNHFAEIFF